MKELNSMRTKDRRGMKVKNVLVIFSIIFILLTFYDGIDGKKSEIEIEAQQHLQEKKSSKINKAPISPIVCHINEEVLRNLGESSSEFQKLKCLLTREGYSNEEVYIPFSFIKSYFDVNGVVQMNNAGPYFSWFHSDSKVYPRFKKTKYNPSGSFLHFAESDVESRPRVKCVTATQDVPLTTQWHRLGHYYPTQIGQYGLSHWSQHLQKMTNATETIYEDGEVHMADWQGDDISRIEDEKCVLFKNQINLSLKTHLDGESIISFDLKIINNVTIEVTAKSTVDRFIIQYIPDSSITIQQKGRMVKFGYGTTASQKDATTTSDNILEGQWKKFTRNLTNDLTKGFLNMNLGTTFLIENIKFEGCGCVTNLSIASSQSLRFFYNAAQWLLANQDSKGGWPVGVTLNKNSFKYTEAEALQPGWYNAMSQGHALSVLTRAYRESHNRIYLESSIKALQLFTLSVEDGGFVTRFMNSSHIWFEEYPTKPSSFVLNGFIYSLLGLYDLWHTLEQEVMHANEFNLAKDLFLQGISTLHILLPFYDTGSGSFYDLRHFTMKTAPKIARWSYHAAHINLLNTLSTLVDDDDEAKLFFLATADRWNGYMVGKKSKHN